MDRFNLIIFSYPQKDDGVLMFCVYPDLLGQDMLAYYRFDNNYYLAFGIYVGDKVTLADECLMKFGYKKVESNNYRC